MCYVKNSYAYVSLGLLWFACVTSSAVADRLHHIDGTVIEGKIISDSGGSIQIDTKYGRLNYDRNDLLRIERMASAATVTSGTAAAAPVNLMRHVPQGPVNPFAPPQMPWLVTLAPKVAAVPTASPAPK